MGDEDDEEASDEDDDDDDDEEEEDEDGCENDDGTDIVASLVLPLPRRCC